MAADYGLLRLRVKEDAAFAVLEHEDWSTALRGRAGVSYVAV